MNKSPFQQLGESTANALNEIARNLERIDGRIVVLEVQIQALIECLPSHPKYVEELASILERFRAIADNGEPHRQALERLSKLVELHRKDDSST